METSCKTWLLQVVLSLAQKRESVYLILFLRTWSGQKSMYRVCTEGFRLMRLLGPGKIRIY